MLYLDRSKEQLKGGVNMEQIRSKLKIIVDELDAETEEGIEEAMESIGSSLNLVVYNDGSTALMDQNSQTREEFEGEIKRICTLNLSPEYWQDTFEENELDMYDFTIDDLKKANLYDDIYETFFEQLTMGQFE